MATAVFEMTQETGVTEDEKLTLEEEEAILEYEKDKRSGVLTTYSLEEMRESLGL